MQPMAAMVPGLKRKLVYSESRRSSSSKRGATVETIAPLGLHTILVTSEEVLAIIWCIVSASRVHWISLHRPCRL